MRLNQNYARELGELLIEQDEAIEKIVPYLEAADVDMNPEGRPAGVFMLLGPTGVGKTHTVETVAQILHGSKKSLLRIDCAEYANSHEIARLIGAPPGYLGHRETQCVFTQQRLSNLASSNSAFAVILFDEVEKAHPDFHQILLGILDKGILTLGSGNIVRFQNTFVFFTSNLGSRDILSKYQTAVGFTPQDSLGIPPQKVLEGIAVRAAKNYFSPEFLNRVDEMMVYKRLSDRAVDKIFDLQVSDFKAFSTLRLKQPIDLHFTSAARKEIIRLGVSPEYGARPLKRVFQQKVVAQVVKILRDDEKVLDSHLWVHLKNGEIVLNAHCGAQEAAR